MPTCNPNIWKYRVHAHLGTDHEQVFFGAFAAGIDPRGDPLFTHASKPLLLNTTNADPLNPVQGVWELNTWLYKAWSAFGVPEKITATMVNAGHAYNQEQREITYAWMLRWTGNDASLYHEEEGPLETEEDLNAARGGSVFNEPDSRRPWELVLEDYQNRKPRWNVLETADDVENHKEKMIPLVRKVLVLKENPGIPDAKIDDSYTRDDVIMEPFSLEPEKGILLPGMLMTSNSASEKKEEVIVYLNEAGKARLSDDWSTAKKLLDDGYTICAVDLRGIGETSPDMTGNYFWDFMAGKPIFGQRVRDVISIVKWLKEREANTPKIRLWGKGLCALYGAMAGVLSEDISSFILEEPLVSFESIVMTEVPGYRNEILLPGVLEKFDMPQIYQALCPKKVVLLNPRGGDKQPATEEVIQKLQDPVLQAFQIVGTPGNWSVKTAEKGKRQEIIWRF